MRRANINQASLFPPADHFNRKTQRRLGQRDKGFGILGHTQRIGRHHAHCIGLKAAQPLGKATQGIECPLLRDGIERLFAGQAGSQTNRLLERIERINLVADHAPDLQTKTV